MYINGLLQRKNAAFTLIEVMVATVISMLILGALAVAFKRLGDTIAQNRASLELTDRMRAISQLLRRDLSGATARGIPPLPKSEEMGYLEYFEGPMADFSAKLFVEMRAAVNPQLEELQRESFLVGKYGDFDDMLMLTCQAPDGEWFYGKVPRYVVELPKRMGEVAALQAPPSSLSYSDALKQVLISIPDPMTPTPIASKYAEVVWFVVPYGLTLQGGGGNFSCLDVDNNLVPDRLMVCRRTLLIRPDLNIPLPNGQMGIYPHFDWREVSAGTRVCGNLNNVSQHCDLSVRFLGSVNEANFDNSGSQVTDVLACNELSDLSIRKNRFAHRTGIPSMSQVTSVGFIDSLWAYSFAVPDLATEAQDALEMGFPHNGAAVLANGPLKPNYILTNTSYVKSSGGGAMGKVDYERASEEVLTVEALGFDIKVFDSTAVALRSAAGDGKVLGPSDPGYALADPSVVVSTGEYVDIGWPRNFFRAGKEFVLKHNIPVDGKAAGYIPPTQGLPLFDKSPMNSSFSGFFKNDDPVVPLLDAMNERWVDSNGNVQNSGSTSLPFSEEMFRSGMVISQSLNRGGPCFGQLVYDSWSTGYESDGELFEDFYYVLGDSNLPPSELYYRNTPSNTRYLGTVRVQAPLNNSRLVADMGGNGSLDFGNSVDDVVEKETLPPFPVKLPGLKVSIRCQEFNASVVQQMSVVEAF